MLENLGDSGATKMSFDARPYAIKGKEGIPKTTYERAIPKKMFYCPRCFVCMI